MTGLKLLGMLGVTDDGEFVFVPMKGIPKLQIMSDVSGVNVRGVDIPTSGVVSVPSPEEEAIAAEKEADMSLDGRLNAAKKRGKIEEGGEK